MFAKNRKNGCDRFHGDKRREQPVNDVVKSKVCLSSIWALLFLLFRLAMQFFIRFQFLKHEQLFILPFSSFLCRGLPYKILAAISPNISRTCKIFTLNASILASEWANHDKNFYQLPKTNGKHLAVTSILWVQRPHVSLQVKWIVQ